MSQIRFGNRILDVYYIDQDSDDPIFKLKDIGVNANILEKLEADEYFKTNGEMYVTELGLYNILSQLDTRNARLWRRVVHEQLIQLRKEKGYTVSEQFDEWDEMANDYYFDEETGRLMKSVTVEGGDVIQVPVN